MSVAIRIIPCLDVKNGRVVKGVNSSGRLMAAVLIPTLSAPARSS